MCSSKHRVIEDIISFLVEPEPEVSHNSLVSEDDASVPADDAAASDDDHLVKKRNISDDI